MSATLEVPAADTAAGLQFVTFQVRDELFGVPLTDVQEIIRMPELVQVPLCPPALEGIANLRGAVLPITSLRRVFGTADAEHDDATRVVVFNQGGSSTGFVVDRMASVITAEPDEIESAETLDCTVRSNMLRGVVKRASGLIMLLDPARLLHVEVVAETRRNGAPPDNLATARARQETANGATVDEIQLVSFEAAGQEYAFPIEDVQEIVQVPPVVTRIPSAQARVVGVITLRERLLPLVSLRRMFELPEAPVDEQSRIVVVSPGGAGSVSVGIVMDTVKEVLRVSRSLTEPVPTLLTTNADGMVNQFEAICRLDGGRRLVTILSAERMFRDETLRAALFKAAGNDEQETAMDGQHNDAATAATDDEEQFVVFRLADEEYGIPIESVQEIVRVPDVLTRVPRTAAFMEGVVNLRGMVLPVVDQRRRFALPEAERNDRQRIMVLTIGGVRTGFIVDQVSEVLQIPRCAIEPAPALSQEQGRLIRRVANLGAQKRMILLLEPGNLLEAPEIAAMETL